MPSKIKFLFATTWHFLLAKSCRTVSNLHSYRRQKDTNDCNVTFFICLYFRRSSTVSDSCWAGICCPGKKYLDLFGGLDVKTWYVSHVVWVYYPCAICRRYEKRDFFCLLSQFTINNTLFCFGQVLYPIS